MSRIVSFVSLALVLACSQAPQPVSSDSAPSASGHATSASDTSEATASEQPARPAVPKGVPVGGAPPAPSAGGLNFVEQAGWVSETPASSLRHRQYKLPSVEGDDEPGELVVFYFHGGGGTAAANIERWCGMFAQDDGTSSREAAVVTEEEVDGMKLTHLDLTGRYIAEMNPGEGVRHNKPEMRMLATIVECSGGPYYIKAVGPKATMDRWAESYDAFIDALK